MNTKQKTTIISAVTKNGVIGIDNKLPWSILKDDMKFFKETTTNHIVIMGYKTWESFGSKPLPNRINIIITSKHILSDIHNVFFVNNIESALIIANQHKLGLLINSNYVRNIFIIGGGTIYKQFLDANLVDEMLLTKVEMTADDETNNCIYFPEFKVQNWVYDTIVTQKANDRNHYNFEIMVFENLMKNE